jgi:hypothetical protein
MLQGRNYPAAAMASIDAMHFRDDPVAGALERHAALAALGANRAGDPLRQRVGGTVRQAVEVVTDLAKVTPPPAGASVIADQLLTARTLLEQNLGVECVYVSQPGYDTHTAQIANQEKLLSELDTALETFWLGTAGGVKVGTIGAMKPDVAGRTMVLIVSEFGRRIGEANGGVGVAGTPPGAAAPVVLVGPPAAARPANAALLVGGLHGDHPTMGTVSAPADNLAMTTDFRHIFQAVLSSWLGDPDPLYAGADSTALKGLFTDAAAPVAAGSRGHATRIGSALSIDAPAPRTEVNGKATAARHHREATATLTQTHGKERRVHPVSMAAALAFNAFVAAVVIRSGRFREALADWRDDTSAS